MKKFFVNLAIVLLLVGVMVGGTFLFPRKLGDGNKPAKPGPEASSASTVLQVIADKIEETSDNFAKMATDTSTSEEDAVSAAAMTGGFKEEDSSEYLWLNQLSSRIVFAVDYLAKNATTENGYANGFEYNKVYLGQLETDGYKGMVYIKTVTVETGVDMYFDFKSEEQNGFQVCFVISMHADYDFEKDEVKKIQMNYQLMPIMAEMWAVEYDFVQNNFRGFQAYDNNYSHTPEQALEILTAYNNGTLKADKMMSYNWTHATIVSGNITDDINKLSFNAYEYWDDNTENLVSNLIITETYNALYGSLRSFKLRTPEEMINSEEEDVHLVNYIQDCVDYGWNKSEVHIWDYNGRTYYGFLFLEYEEMVSILTEVKEAILADETATEDAKELATCALAYIEAKGKKLYTGKLGTHNGLSMQMENFSTMYNNKIVGGRDISTKNGTTIHFYIVDGHIQYLNYNKISA